MLGILGILGITGISEACWLSEISGLSGPSEISGLSGPSGISWVADCSSLGSTLSMGCSWVARAWYFSTNSMISLKASRFEAVHLAFSTYSFFFLVNQ